MIIRLYGISEALEVIQEKITLKGPKVLKARF